MRIGHRERNHRSNAAAPLRSLGLPELCSTQAKEALEERSEKWANNILAILSNMVRTARELRLIRELPLEKYGLFKVDNSKPPPFYTEEEYGRLVEAALKVDLRVAAAILLGGEA